MSSRRCRTSRSSNSKWAPGGVCPVSSVRHWVTTSSIVARLCRVSYVANRRSSRSAYESALMTVLSSNRPSCPPRDRLTRRRVGPEDHVHYTGMAAPTWPRQRDVIGDRAYRHEDPRRHSDVVIPSYPQWTVCRWRSASAAPEPSRCTSVARRRHSESTRCQSRPRRRAAALSFGVREPST
jgi:hypothetical protein